MFSAQVIEMAPHLETVYVSGWQCSSTASTRCIIIAEFCRRLVKIDRFGVGEWDSMTVLMYILR